MRNVVAVLILLGAMSLPRDAMANGGGIPWIYVLGPPIASVVTTSIVAPLIATAVDDEGTFSFAGGFFVTLLAGALSALVTGVLLANTPISFEYFMLMEAIAPAVVGTATTILLYHLWEPEPVLNRSRSRDFASLLLPSYVAVVPSRHGVASVALGWSL